MAVTVQFDFSFDSSGFFAPASQARALVLAAGDFYSDLLTDSLSAITSGGVNQFNASVFNPGGTPNPCVSANPDIISLPGYSVAADTVVVFIAGRGDLASGSLGCGGPGGYSASGTAEFLDLVETRDQGAPTSGATATEFAPWGGAIAFSTTANWYLDANPATTESFTGSDFYSTVLHELGHVLGIGTASAWFNQIQAGRFIGSAVVAAFGNSAPVTADRTHWASGTQSTVNGRSQEAAFDPTLSNGVRKQLTTLDVAALDDIGWSIKGAPPPDPVPTRVPLAPPWALALLVSALYGLTWQRAPRRANCTRRPRHPP